MARDDEHLDEPEDDEIDEIEEIEGDGDEPGGSHGALGFFGGLVLGVLLGAGTALLLAPERGTQVRRRIGRQVRRFRRDAEEKVGEIRENAEHEFRRARRRLRRPHRD
jgi:Sec-independent protein translocase protein TatA